MELDTALAYARDHRRGVLTTIRADGRPQLSNIMYAVDDAGTIRISVTDGRAKTANARRDPRVSLHITSDDFWSYVVIDADAEVGAVTTAPGDAAGRELADLYRSLAGEHDDWDDYFAAMVRDHRLVLTLHPTSAYGMVPD